MRKTVKRRLVLYATCRIADIVLLSCMFVIKGLKDHN